MAENLYHQLGFIPGTREWEMAPGLESLAERLVTSGKLRINADHERNYVRHGTTDADKTFTARELSDPVLLPRTLNELRRHVAPAMGEHGLNELHRRLLADLRRGRGISPEKEMKVARVLVQSAHPAVIRLLLKSGAEIFVSYSHNVGDLMPVHAWETIAGTASGLQATEMEGQQVFISCGGDPFFEGEERTYVTDGFPALARMTVIAGQELGHFADLRRDASGNVTGRYSVDTNYSQLRAHPRAREARLADMARVAQLKKFYAAAGLESLRRAERGVAFYHTRWRFTPHWWFYQAWRFVAWTQFVGECRARRLLTRVRSIPYLRLGEAVETWLADMEFNLAPDADAYRNPDPLVEEAIACIEAVARVPQQEHKWGVAAVAFSWPGLSQFYAGTVLPAVMAAAGGVQETDYTNKIQKIIIAWRRQITPRPGYFPPREATARK